MRSISSLDDWRAMDYCLLLICLPFLYAWKPLYAAHPPLRVFVFRGLARHPQSRLGYQLSVRGEARKSTHGVMQCLTQHNSQPWAHLYNALLTGWRQAQGNCTSSPRQLRSQWLTPFLSFLYTNQTENAQKLTRNNMLEMLRGSGYYFPGVVGLFLLQFITLNNEREASITATAVYWKNAESHSASEHE